MQALDATQRGLHHEVLQHQTVPYPDVQANDVLIKVAYSDLNPVDLQKLQKGPPIKNGSIHIPGYGGAGTVEQVGSNVPNKALVGKQVCFVADPSRPHGSYASHIVVDHHCVAVLPMGTRPIDLRDAASIPVAGLAAYECLAKLGLLAADKKLSDTTTAVPLQDSSSTQQHQQHHHHHHSTVEKADTQSLLIVGAAVGVGSWLLTLAEAWHPNMKLIATVSSPADSQAWCESLGASQVIRHHEINQQLLLTSGIKEGSVEYIVCPTPTLFATLANVIRPNGKIVLVVAGNTGRRRYQTPFQDCSCSRVSAYVRMLGTLSSSLSLSLPLLVVAGNQSHPITAIPRQDCWLCRRLPTVTPGNHPSCLFFGLVSPRFHILILMLLFAVWPDVVVGNKFHAGFLSTTSTTRARHCSSFLQDIHPPLFIPYKMQQFTKTILYQFPTSTNSDVTTDLESLTVKELKQLIKDGSQPVQRGLLSKLKRKQDLLDYLKQQQQKQHQQLEETFNIMAPEPEPTARKRSTTATEKKHTPKKSTSTTTTNTITATKISSVNDRSPKVPLKMPPVTNHSGYSSDDASGTTSLKDYIFEKVFERYPPIREHYYNAQYAAAAAAVAAMPSAATATPEPTDNTNSPTDAESDIRQMYHPIFESSNHIKSCDMDIVFIGTASCTPGVTRGVSCTALRLNWKRRAAFRDPYEQPQQQQQQQQKADTNNNSNRNDSISYASDFQGGTWLFDVGECTQLQVQRTSSIRPSKITKIFLTHAHGDHSFGLPGILCLMGQDRDRSRNVIDIYGPEGLRKWLRVAIRYSVSRIVPPYRVHELKEVPMAPEWVFNERSGRYFFKGIGENKKHSQPLRGKGKPWGAQGLAGEDPNSWITQSERIHLDPSSQYGEVRGGRDIFPIYGHPLSNDGAPVWEVEDEEDVKVYAAPMSHGIPCVGYVVQETSRPGRLRNEIVQPMVLRNLEALKEAGYGVPMKAMAVIKNLPVGSSFTFPDGTVITQKEAVEPPRKGRKVVICGDTANCRALEILAKDCDVLVHEATNAYLPGIDRDTNLRLVTRDAVLHGHSTPELAGLLAKKVNAKKLLLNHFSSRYKGDPSLESMSIMMRIEEFAMLASGLNETRVAAAWDLMVLPIPSHE